MVSSVNDKSWLDPIYVAATIVVVVVVVVVVLVLVLCRYKYSNYCTSPPTYFYGRFKFDIPARCEAEGSVIPIRHRNSEMGLFQEVRQRKYLPKELKSFINDRVIPCFKDQRKTNENQFAVVLPLPDSDYATVRFEPSDELGWPVLNKEHPVMPKDEEGYSNYIAAQPINNNCHSEEVIFGKYSTINSPFDELWRAYVDRNGTSPICILLYSWNQPCARCTDVIIRVAEEKSRDQTKFVVVHTTFWPSETENEREANREKLIKNDITIYHVRYPEFIPPATTVT